MSRLICIDPGHGGSQPGAVGFVTTSMSRYTLAEKDVVFGLNSEAIGGIGVANRVGHHLRKAGLSTIMTREADVDVSLKARARAAVSAKADMFVSIHCNSYHNTSANGVEVYYHPSQSNGANVLSRKILDSILSKKECKGLRDRGVKTARFTVLQDTYKYMPAVLIELPFISNPKEAKLLADRYFREAVGIAIADAIMGWSR